MTERLLAHLQSKANSRGLVLANEDALLEKLATTHDALTRALNNLETQGMIEISSPLPFVVIKVPKWSGSNHPRVRKEQQISNSKRSLHIEVPVSSAAAAATQEVGGLGEGEALLGEVLALLGPEADRTEFRRILAGQDGALIHRCLRRVQATKAIRVSRAALFRSLLQKLSH
jgi:hypothetical protein